MNEQPAPPMPFRFAHCVPKELKQGGVRPTADDFHRLREAAWARLWQEGLVPMRHPEGGGEEPHPAKARERVLRVVLWSLNRGQLGASPEPYETTVARLEASGDLSSVPAQSKKAVVERRTIARVDGYVQEILGAPRERLRVAVERKR